MATRVQEILNFGLMTMEDPTRKLWKEHQVLSMIGVMSAEQVVIMEACRFMQQTCQVQFLHLIVGIVMKHQILGLEIHRVITLIGHML